MLEDNFLPLKPISFFQIEWDCRFCPEKERFKEIQKKEYLVPTSSSLTAEEKFADLHMGWNEEGLVFLFISSQSFHDAFYPDIQRGDSLELFIDTRDIKTSGFNTKFCHHFFFLPQAADDIHAGEISRFRTEDSHELITGKELFVQTDFFKKGYEMRIFIPSSALYGYDPKMFNRLGFTYRMNRYGAPSQHFSAITEEFTIEQQPSLWSRTNLIYENSSLPPTSKKRR